jgi:signal transduction histidine kinase
VTAAAARSSAASRLLVVDDDEGLLILMSEALRTEGHEVESAASGRDALRWLERHTPDLVLLDLKLADVDTKDVIARLESGPVRVPFIVVTGQGDERVAVDVMKRGALDYVMKDSAMLDLLPSVVQRALDALAREHALAAARAEHARLEGEVLAASERERHSIGADLHDGLGQLLTAVEFMCTALKEDTVRTQPEIAARLDQMGGMLREAVAQTRFLSRGLVPIGHGPDALHQGLTALAERTHALGRTACEFESDGIVEVADATAANHLYRIAQEAVNNALKHARGQRIVVRLTRRPGWLVLEIEDDGVGLARASEGKGAGLGLMRYRASLIGADLAVKSRRGGGVVVTCSWPQPA